MRRRPWLALVMLVLLGISATMFVRATRAVRMDDDYALAFAFDDDVGPCEVPVVLVAELARAHTMVDEVPLVVVATRADSIIAIAPKTSPPA